MQPYLPESMQAPTPLDAVTLEQLRRWMEQGAVLTVPALWCDEDHNLHLSLGGLPAVIPRDRAALGIAEGTVREIAILSRVGKAVCCRIEAIPDHGPIVLSRTAVQRDALHHLLYERKPGDILPAVVTNTTAFGVFCDVGCGVPALLPLENISVSRISHGSDRFDVGQVLYVVLQRQDLDAGRVTVTLKELLGTWEENAARFQTGQTVPAIVRSIQPYGVFLELTPNLSGLAEADDTLHPGQVVSAYIKAILPDRQKIKLSILDTLDPALLPPPVLRYTQTEGHLEYWEYSLSNARLRTVFPR